MIDAATLFLMREKVCTRCGLSKLLLAFPIDRKMRDGRNSWCKLCYREKTKIHNSSQEWKKHKSQYDKAYTSANRDRIRVMQRMGARRRASEGRRPMWAKNNPEARRAIAMTHKVKRRAQCEQGMTTKELRVWLSYQQFLCVWCGTDCAESYHIDHVWPLSKGGKHEWNNLAIACPTCNLRKSARDPIEFAKEMQELAA